LHAREHLLDCHRRDCPVVAIIALVWLGSVHGVAISAASPVDQCGPKSGAPRRCFATPRDGSIERACEAALSVIRDQCITDEVLPDLAEQRARFAPFGNWSTAFRRFRDWREADVFKRIFDALSEEPDMEYAMVDATIVKVHRHGQGAKGGLRARPLAVPKAA
jgi:transposase